MGNSQLHYFLFPITRINLAIATTMPAMAYILILEIVLDTGSELVMLFIL